MMDLISHMRMNTDLIRIALPWPVLYFSFLSDKELRIKCLNAKFLTMNTLQLFIQLVMVFFGSEPKSQIICLIR